MSKIKIKVKNDSNIVISGSDENGEQYNIRPNTEEIITASHKIIEDLKNILKTSPFLKNYVSFQILEKIKKTRKPRKIKNEDININEINDENIKIIERSNSGKEVVIKVNPRGRPKTNKEKNVSENKKSKKISTKK